MRTRMSGGAGGVRRHTCRRPYPNSVTILIYSIFKRLSNVPHIPSLPMALAAAINMEQGEEVQWELDSRKQLHLLRPNIKDKNQK